MVFPSSISAIMFATWSGRRENSAASFAAMSIDTPYSSCLRVRLLTPFFRKNDFRIIVPQIPFFYNLIEPQKPNSTCEKRKFSSFDIEKSFTKHKTTFHFFIIQLSHRGGIIGTYLKEYKTNFPPYFYTATLGFFPFCIRALLYFYAIFQRLLKSLCFSGQKQKKSV